MFSLLQITTHSHKQLLPIHPQTFLHAIHASPSLHAHLWPLRVVYVCLLVGCVSEWPLEWTTVDIRVVLLLWILNVSLCLYVCCGIPVRVGASRQPKLFSVCLSLIHNKLRLCVLAFSPPLHPPFECSCRLCYFLLLVWMHSHPSDHSKS